MPDKRRGWKEKVAIALQPLGTEKAGLWFTHKAILRRMREQGHDDAPDSLRSVLTHLVKDGYLDRAQKPDRIKTGKLTPKPEFIYRRTMKAFKAKTFKMRRATHESVAQGYRLYLEHTRLPKWFRDMMK